MDSLTTIKPLGLGVESGTRSSFAGPSTRVPSFPERGVVKGMKQRVVKGCFPKTQDMGREGKSFSSRVVGLLTGKEREHDHPLEMLGVISRGKERRLC